MNSIFQTVQGSPQVRPHAALVLPALLLLAGCAADQYRRLPDPNPVPYDRAGIQQVMEEMDERRNGIDDAAVRMNLVLRDLVKNKEHGLSGIYLGDKNGNLRLQMSYGESKLLDFAIHGEIVDLWLPRKNRFYRGTRKDLLAATDCELSLLAQVGQVNELFFPRAWTNQAVERRVRVEGMREIVSVLERPGLLRRCVRRVTISPEFPVAEEVVVFKAVNHSEKCLGTLRYADYRFPGPLAGARDKTNPGVIWPGRVTLISADKAHSLQMDIGEFNTNRSIPLSKYEIEVPREEATVPGGDQEGSARPAASGKAMPILDLGQALQCGKGLWE